VDIPNSGWFSVYFTDPSDPAAVRYRGGPDQKLAEAIDNARLSVDIAVMDLDLWSVRDALIAAHRRGVAVRMVVESDYLEGEEIQDILAAGIPVLGDRREGLMHDKFVVIDRSEVWTGSLNYTVSDAYRNNNLLRLRSSQLADDYTHEFEEMFVDDRFGPGSPADTPYPAVTVEGGQIEVYFSPDDGVSRQLVDLINGARQSVNFMAFSFTSDDLAEALLGRYDAGVDITGVMEASQVASNNGSDYERFLEAGMYVSLDGNPNQMHHKVIIIDGKTVVTGSYNFSRSAEEKNDENLLVIHSPEIAAIYMEEFQRILSQAQE
jgi:phosphatidylserine/phosphatidylglycerophosphate/cardiolipin synthase-like enzyme